MASVEIRDMLVEMDKKMKNYKVEFFIDIDGIRGIIHIIKNTTSYSGIFTYIVFREYKSIETRHCQNIKEFTTELDKLLKKVFTNKFFSPEDSESFGVWRKYVHHLQGIAEEEVTCYVCLEDSYDSTLACGHHICKKCLQKSSKNINSNTTTVKCGICRKQIIRKVVDCPYVGCNHNMCPFIETISS